MSLTKDEYQKLLELVPWEGQGDAEYFDGVAEVLDAEITYTEPTIEWRPPVNYNGLMQNPNMVAYVDGKPLHQDPKFRAFFSDNYRTRANVKGTAELTQKFLDGVDSRSSSGTFGYASSAGTVMPLAIRWLNGEGGSGFQSNGQSINDITALRKEDYSKISARLADINISEDKIEDASGKDWYGHIVGNAKRYFVQSDGKLKQTSDRISGNEEDGYTYSGYQYFPLTVGEGEEEFTFAPRFSASSGDSMELNITAEQIEALGVVSMSVGDSALVDFEGGTWTTGVLKEKYNNVTIKQLSEEAGVQRVAGTVQNDIEYYVPKGFVGVIEKDEAGANEFYVYDSAKRPRPLHEDANFSYEGDGDNGYTLIYDGERVGSSDMDGLSLLADKARASEAGWKVDKFGNWFKESGNGWSYRESDDSSIKWYWQSPDSDWIWAQSDEEGKGEWLFPGETPDGKLAYYAKGMEQWLQDGSEGLATMGGEEVYTLGQLSDGEFAAAPTETPELAQPAAGNEAGNEVGDGGGNEAGNEPLEGTAPVVRDAEYLKNATNFADLGSGQYAVLDKDGGLLEVVDHMGLSEIEALNGDTTLAWTQAPQSVLEEQGLLTPDLMTFDAGNKVYQGQAARDAAFSAATEFAKKHRVNDRNWLSTTWDKVFPEDANPFRFLHDFFGGNSDLERARLYDEAWNAAADLEARKTRASSLVGNYLNAGGQLPPNMLDDPLAQAAYITERKYLTDANGNPLLDGNGAPRLNPNYDADRSIFFYDDDGKEHTWSPGWQLPVDFKEQEHRIRGQFKDITDRHMSRYQDTIPATITVDGVKVANPEAGENREFAGMTRYEKQMAINRKRFDEMGGDSIFGDAMRDSVSYLYGDADTEGSYANLNKAYLDARKHYSDQINELEDLALVDHLNRKSAYVDALGDTSAISDARNRAAEMVGRARIFGGKIPKEDYFAKDSNNEFTDNYPTPEPSIFDSGSDSIYKGYGGDPKATTASEVTGGLIPAADTYVGQRLAEWKAKQAAKTGMPENNRYLKTGTWKTGEYVAPTDSDSSSFTLSGTAQQ